MTAERRPTLLEYTELWMATVMRHLPVTWSSAIGGYFGARHGRRAIAKRRKWVRRMHENLERYSLVKDPREQERRIVEYTRRIGRIYGEFAVLQRLVEEGRVEVVGLDNLSGLSKPAIVASAHLSNWELVGHVMVLLGGPAADLYVPPANPIRHRLILEARNRWGPGGELIPASPTAMVRLQKALKRGADLILFVDEERDGYVWAPALGRRLSLGGNRWFAARLAARQQVDILPVHVETIGLARYRIVIEPKLVPVGEDADDRARSLADQMEHRLEAWIRARPEEWYWLSMFEFDRQPPG